MLFKFLKSLFCRQNKVIKTRKLLKWVKKQPDDRILNMDQNMGSDENIVGCVMYQYARDVLKIPPNKIFCGCETISDDRSKIKYKLETTIFKIFPKAWAHNVDTFGELKRGIND